MEGMARPFRTASVPGDSESVFGGVAGPFADSIL
jgi:hypothetical protein